MSVSKAYSNVKFQKFRRKINRKPAGGSWYSSKDDCQVACRVFHKALRREGKQITTNAMRGS